VCVREAGIRTWPGGVGVIYQRLCTRYTIQRTERLTHHAGRAENHPLKFLPHNRVNRWHLCWLAVHGAALLPAASFSPVVPWRTESDDNVTRSNRCAAQWTRLICMRVETYAPCPIWRGDDRRRCMTRCVKLRVLSVHAQNPRNYVV